MPANRSNTMSSDGHSQLSKHEGSIDGLYNDQAGYATYGVGHLVHKANKWPSFLLAAAQANEKWASKTGKKYGNVQYLRRGSALADLSELEKAAVEEAKKIIAQTKYKKGYDELEAKVQENVSGIARAAVKEEIRLLPRSAENILTEDLRDYETAVNYVITEVELLQEEYEALVSLCFNIGVDAFANSQLAKKINDGQYRSGDLATRQRAITAIENEFMNYTKTGKPPKENADLRKRRKAEATLFLKAAREELKSL